MSKAKNGKSDPAPRTGLSKTEVLERTTIWLPVDLTTDELLERGRKVGELWEKRQRLDREFAAAKAAHKSEIEAIADEEATLSRALATGKESREVECETVLDFEHDCARTVRLDSHTIVSKRPLEHSERQRKFKLVSRAKAVADDPAVREQARKLKDMGVMGVTVGTPGEDA